jgi:hypothetical protein
MIKRVLTLVNALQFAALPHITASVFINDDERGPHHDYEVWLEGLGPHASISQYQHNRTGEDNADAHLKRQMTGNLSLLKERSRDRISIGSAMSVPRGALTGPSFLLLHSLCHSAAPASMPRSHQ